MTKNEQLDNLFEEWRCSYSGYKKQFIKDGIINEEQYSRQKPKILFITKEANDKTGTLLDFRKHWSKPLRHSFDYRIAELAFGIQHSFPSFDTIYQNLFQGKKEYKEALSKIAFMDVKKSCGKSRCDHKELIKNINLNKSFIHRQIDIIDPDIIVSGLVDINVVRSLFGDVDFKQAGYVRCVFRWNKYKVIDFYHPSGQSAPAAMYTLMERIYNSDVFASL